MDDGIDFKKIDALKLPEEDEEDENMTDTQREKRKKRAAANLQEYPFSFAGISSFHLISR